MADGEAHDRQTKVSEGKKKAFQKMRQETKRFVSDWTVADCVIWLKENNFGDFVLDFYNSGFGGSELLRVDERTFGRIFATNPSQCMELAAAIDILRKREGLGIVSNCRSVMESESAKPPERARPSLKRQISITTPDHYGWLGCACRSHL
jgi:hypothetical protein